MSRVVRGAHFEIVLDEQSLFLSSSSRCSVETKSGFYYCNVSKVEGSFRYGVFLKSVIWLNI
jgi:hypothetical protein